MYSSLHVKIRVNRQLTVRCPADLLQRRQGTVRHRTVTGRASADVFMYRRWPVSVRFVTTQEKILKNRRVPGRIFRSSPVMCKSLKSYDVRFICDQSISINSYFHAHISFISQDHCKTALYWNKNVLIRKNCMQHSLPVFFNFVTFINTNHLFPLLLEYLQSSTTLMGINESGVINLNLHPKWVINRYV